MIYEPFPHHHMNETCSIILVQLFSFQSTNGAWVVQFTQIKYHPFHLSLQKKKKKKGTRTIKSFHTFKLTHSEKPVSDKSVRLEVVCCIKPGKSAQRCWWGLSAASLPNLLPCILLISCRFRAATRSRCAHALRNGENHNLRPLTVGYNFSKLF